MSIGTNIQYYRKKMNLSQKELAEKLGYSTGTIQQYDWIKENLNLKKYVKLLSL